MNTPTPANTDTNTEEKKFYDEEQELDPSAVAAMSQDEKLTRLAEYQKLVNTGHEFGITAYRSAIRLVHSIRARAVADNPRAKKAAKEKTAVQAVSLESLLSKPATTPKD